MPDSEFRERIAIKLRVNGREIRRETSARKLLADFIRDDLGLTATHLGCEHGVCGACTVIVDGKAVRSCLMLAVQADGATISTVEGLAAQDGTLHPVQQALRDEHALQCGFCTPGIVMTLAALTDGDAQPSAAMLLDAVSGHLCRCTGYQGIRRAACKLAGAPMPESDHP